MELRLQVPPEATFGIFDTADGKVFSVSDFAQTAIATALLYSDTGRGAGIYVLTDRESTLLTSYVVAANYVKVS
jgi:hypothetical protein